ncbi:hypothetical protein WMF38_56845 [Sorangium sp. So ce118]
MSRYCIIGNHAIQESETSCSTRAKPLHVAGPHESGVRHAHHVGAEESACNLGQWLDTRAVQPISARVKGARAENFGLSAEVFRESMRWAQVSGRDVAAATGHDSPKGVYQMARGEKVIAADAVYGWMRRLPELGVRIIAFCASELPEQHRQRLPALIDEAVEIKRKMGWSK